MDSERLRRLMFRPQILAFATPTVKAKVPKPVTAKVDDGVVCQFRCGCKVSLFPRSSCVQKCPDHTDLDRDSIIRAARVETEEADYVRAFASATTVE